MLGLHPSRCDSRRDTPAPAFSAENLFFKSKPTARSTLCSQLRTFGGIPLWYAMAKPDSVVSGLYRLGLSSRWRAALANVNRLGHQSSSQRAWNHSQCFPIIFMPSASPFVMLSGSKLALA